MSQERYLLPPGDWSFLIERARLNQGASLLWSPALFSRPEEFHLLEAFDLNLRERIACRKKEEEEAEEEEDEELEEEDEDWEEDDLGEEEDEEAEDDEDCV